MGYQVTWWYTLGQGVVLLRSARGHRCLCFCKDCLCLYSLSWRFLVAASFCRWRSGYQFSWAGRMYTWRYRVNIARACIGHRQQPNTKPTMNTPIINSSHPKTLVYSRTTRTMSMSLSLDVPPQLFCVTSLWPDKQ